MLIIQERFISARQCFKLPRIPILLKDKIVESAKERFNDVEIFEQNGSRVWGRADYKKGSSDLSVRLYFYYDIPGSRIKIDGVSIYKADQIFKLNDLSKLLNDSFSPNKATAKKIYEYAASVMALSANYFNFL